MITSPYSLALLATSISATSAEPRLLCASQPKLCARFSLSPLYSYKDACCARFVSCSFKWKLQVKKHDHALPVPFYKHPSQRYCLPVMKFDLFDITESIVSFSNQMDWTVIPLKSIMSPFLGTVNGGSRCRGLHCARVWVLRMGSEA
jgi:hypothetical protein